MRKHAVYFAGYEVKAANLLQQMRTAGNESRWSIATALSTATWDGITRNIRFDAKGDVVDPVVWVSKVQGGTFVAIGSVNTNK